MIDDATSRIHARFVLHDSTEEDMRLLWSYLEGKGRPLSFYTDKASLFQTAPKVARDRKALPPEEQDPLPPTQIGRALQELDIVWIPAHSPQAKGRVERGFQTARASTLEQANAYLEEQFIPWWNKITVVAASVDDAHRPLAATHSLPASLSYVETKQVNNDYTIQFDNKIYLIARTDIRTGLRGGRVRVEVRMDGSLAVRFRDVYVAVTECLARRKVEAARNARKPAAPRKKSPWMSNFHLTSPDKDSVVHYSVGISGASGKRQSVGRAKAARPASRLIDPKTAARELHLSRVSTAKNHNPRAGHLRHSTGGR